MASTVLNYQPQADNVKAWVLNADAKAPRADPVAEVVFKAATDASVVRG